MFLDPVEFHTLQGKTLVKIEVDRTAEEIRFLTSDGDEFKMCHISECCETVYIEDITGDLEDLIHLPLTLAEKVTEEAEPRHDYSASWTFFKLSTIRGSVTFRWFGEGSGHYAEDAAFRKVVR